MIKKLKKSRKLMLLVVFSFVVIIFLIVMDKLNLITNIGLSPTLWTTVVTMCIPLLTTIILWNKEKTERIKQVLESNKLSNQLIIRTKYFEYFEELLEKINDYIIFINVYFIREKGLFPFVDDKKTPEQLLDEKITSIHTRIKTDCFSNNYNNSYLFWEIDFNRYAFKSIDIDTFKYMYNGEEINLPACMQLLQVRNIFSSIKNEEKLVIRGSGGYLEKVDEEEQRKLIQEMINNKEYMLDLSKFLEYLKKDIEKKLNL